jgi:hypothetical protein
VDIQRSEFYDPPNKIIWFVLLFYLPVLGVILYGIIGSSRKKNVKNKYEMELLSRLTPDK